MNKFINPYTFFPKSAPRSPLRMEEVRESLKEQLGSGPAAALTHDRYLKQVQRIDGGQQAVFSGEVECELKTCSPCVFGAHQADNCVENFFVEREIDDAATLGAKPKSADRQRLTAVAGTSIKGMLSTVMEAVSGSTMRVLKNHILSIRQTMQQSLTAIGLVVGEGEQRSVVPLCLPTYGKDQQGKFIPNDGSANEIWQAVRQRSRKYGVSLNATYVQRPGNVHSDNLPWHRGNTVVALSSEMTGVELPWDEDTAAPKDEPGYYRRDRDDDGKKVRSIIRPAKFLPPPTPTIYSGANGQQPGILRRIEEKVTRNGNAGFDMFLHIPAGWCQKGQDGQYHLDYAAIPEELKCPAVAAIENFELMVRDELSTVPEKDRSATALVGQDGFLKKHKKQAARGYLKQGDIVCIKLQMTDNSIETERVSMASIWREGPLFLWPNKDNQIALLNDPDDRPMHPARTIVTMAERMLGWVMDDVAAVSRSTMPVKAYRGRIHFTDAVSDELLENVQLKSDQVDGYFTLPILASPKLPCPEFYLTSIDPERAKFVRQDFVNASECLQVQGWKFYWCHTNEPGDGDSDYWTTHGKENSDMKLRVRPIKSGTSYRFKVRFNNLTESELGLLLFALEPHTSFWHRLGLGKPLGLGVVKINVIGVHCFQRVGRYRGAQNIFSADRCPLVNVDCSALRAQTEELLGKETVERIVKFGQAPTDSEGSLITISYPPNREGGRETKLYQWFTSNKQHDGSVRQVLDVDDPILTR